MPYKILVVMISTTIVVCCDRRREPKTIVAREAGVIIVSEEQRSLQQDFEGLAIKILQDSGYRFAYIQTMNDVDNTHVISFTWSSNQSLDVGLAGKSMDRNDALRILDLLKSISGETNIKSISIKLYDYVESVQYVENGIFGNKYFWRNLRFEKVVPLR